MAMDVAHSVLGALVVAMGAGMFGKYLSNKEARERLAKLEFKLVQAVPTIFCEQKHLSLNELLEEKFGNLTGKVDLLIGKVDKLNNK